MLYKLPGAVYIKGHIRNRSTNQTAGNSLFSSEIILKIVFGKSPFTVTTLKVR